MRRVLGTVVAIALAVLLSIAVAGCKKGGSSGGGGGYMRGPSVTSNA